MMGVTNSPSWSTSKSPTSSITAKAYGLSMGLTTSNAPSNRSTSSSVSGAPLSPSTQHAPLHLLKSQANKVSNTSSEINVSPSAIMWTKLIRDCRTSTTESLGIKFEHGIGLETSRTGRTRPMEKGSATEPRTHGQCLDCTSGVRPKSTWQPCASNSLAAQPEH